MTQIIKKILLVIGGLALAAVLTAMVAPKSTHAFVATLVQIANTAANPVPTEEALGAAVLARVVCGASSQQGRFQFVANCIDTLSGSGAQFVVPAGKRLIIEQLDGGCLTPSGNSFTDARIETVRADSSPGFGQRFRIPLQFLGRGLGNDSYVISQSVRGYAEAGSSFVFVGDSTDFSGNTLCGVDIVGRLVPTS
jgi:hypothetical protein